MFNIHLDKREFSKPQKGQVEYQNIIFWKEEQYIKKYNDKDKYINIAKIHKAATNRTKGRNEHINHVIRNFICPPQNPADQAQKKAKIGRCETHSQRLGAYLYTDTHVRIFAKINHVLRHKKRYNFKDSTSLRPCCWFFFLTTI